MVHVSVTGLRLVSVWSIPLFWRHALPLKVQARRAAGNLFTDARKIDGVHHTLSIWRSREDMLAFMRSGAHVRAMKDFGKIATGSTCGYGAERVPSWEEAIAHWREHGREYRAR